MSRTRHILVLAFALLAIGAAPAAAGWPIYGHDVANTRNARGDGPSVAKVPSLAEAWRFDSPTGDFTGTPVVARGLLVAGDYSGTVYALDAVTGKVRWKRKLDGPVDASAAIDAGHGTVYVPVAKVGSPKLVALALRTGKRRWSRVLTNQPSSSAYGSPTFSKGTVYIGTSGPNGDDSTARGTLVALRASDGALRWRRYIVPPGRDGGPVWSTPAIDTKTGRLYVGTGNAYHDPAAATTDAILALSAKTGAIVGRYQAIPGDIFGGGSHSGPDADFGASPNLFTDAAGRRLVGEGAKDGFYYALDRSTMKLAWKTALGPGSQIGGFVGSTALDGARIYGTNALSGQVGALRRDGSPAWSGADGGAADFAPVATGNGVLYSVNQSGVLAAREARTGAVLTRMPLGQPTFGGIALEGRAVYVAIGVGPPPPPAPQQDGTGSIVALGDTSRSGAHGRGTRMRVRVHPRKVRAGRHVRFHFRVTTSTGRPIQGALVRFAGRHARTGPHGRAGIGKRFRHPGRRHARVTAAGFGKRTVTVRVGPADG
jgi:polyvinyl alcohol dehydrogenase (cytochrome)